jgi:hypothetical protein
MDPQYKIDAGELMYGKELLGELEICSAGSDLFNEDLKTKVTELERNGTPAARSVIGRLRATRAIVTLHVLDGERDPQQTWELLGPLWAVLPSLSSGLTQSDGQGFYDGGQLLIALA